MPFERLPLFLTQNRARRGVADSPPPAGGEAMPNAGNTGPRVGLTLSSGDYAASTPGATVSALHITGNVTATADNVTFNDCQIDGAVYPQSNGLTMNYCSWPGMYADSSGGLQIDGITCYRNRVGNQEDDFVDLNNGNNTTQWCKNVTFSYCMFDRLIASTGDRHLDCIQVLGCDNVQIRYCYFDFTGPDQATRDQMTCVITYEYSWNGHTSAGWRVEGCDIHGGGAYSTDLFGTSGFLLNNKFYSLAVSGAFSYGTSPMLAYPGSAYTQSGNTLDGSPWSGPTS